MLIAELIMLAASTVASMETVQSCLLERLVRGTLLL